MARIRIRPARVVSTALATTAAWCVAFVVADPAFARSAGIDVWNIGTLESELRAADHGRVFLETKHIALQHIYQTNDALVQDLIEARVSLRDAAEQLMIVNRPVSGFAETLRLSYHGPNMTAKAADNLMHRVARYTDLADSRKAEALARLRLEYAAEYGVPAMR
jgi:hypothetical protein